MPVPKSGKQQVKQQKQQAIAKVNHNLANLANKLPDNELKNLLLGRSNAGFFAKRNKIKLDKTVAVYEQNRIANAICLQ